MSRLLLCALVSWAALASNTPARADEFEDLAVAEVRKVGGAVVRDETRPDKPVVGLKMRFNGLVNDLTLKHIVAFKSLTLRLLGGRDRSQLAALIDLLKKSSLCLFGGYHTNPSRTQAWTPLVFAFSGRVVSPRPPLVPIAANAVGGRTRTRDVFETWPTDRSSSSS